MKSLRFILPLAVFLVLAGFLAVGLKLDPRAVPSPLINKPAPAFVLPRLDDASKTMRRDDLLGKAWVLNVWASLCGPCRDEHPQVRIAAGLAEAAPRGAVCLVCVGVQQVDQRGVHDTRNSATRAAGF